MTALAGEGKKNPFTAGALSLIPGLGQLYVGKTGKAAALLCIDAGMAASLYFFSSGANRVLTGVIYLAVALPAGVESWFIAKTGRSSAKFNSKTYVFMMLLTTGCMALPLLWQHAGFSRGSKILCTIAVLLLAALFFWSMAKMQASGFPDIKQST